MDGPQGHGDSFGLSGCMACALITGGITFLGGFVGPLIVSPSNLGPLLGIFVTGPIGFLMGALIGIIWAGKVTNLAVGGSGSRSGLPAARSRLSQKPLGRELGWLAAVWVVSLVYVLVFASIGLRWITFSLLVVLSGATAYVLYGHKMRLLPRSIAHFRLPLIIAAVLVVVSTMFPPIRMFEPGQARFAFFLDPRFDASKQVPLFQVDQMALAGEWLALLLFALAGGLMIRSRTQSRSGE